ncbi:conjugal transfer protein TraH [Acidithiobacillus sp. MC6.1]|nr:conjugal transfer protein TraH [Acidithiobacillus sp. MC6.1]
MHTGKGKKWRMRRAVSATLIGAIIGSSASMSVTALAGSGLNQSLNDMLVATGGPGVYQSQQAMVLSGGYAAVRIPNQTYNVVSFAVPNLSMGCGGINLFLGSFSFINATQFVAMLKQIGTGLAVVAFQTALSTMCAHCMDILNYLQQAMQQMNNAMRGYCSAGTGFSISNFMQSMGKAGQAFKHLGSAAMGDASGFTSALSGSQTAPGQGYQNLLGNEVSATSKYFGLPTSKQVCTTNSSGAQSCSTVSVPATSTSTQTVSGTAAGLLPDMGNFTWRAMKDSNAETLLSGTANNDEVAMEMVMSIVGTTIVQPASNTTVSGAQAGSKPRVTPYSGTIGLSQLRSGNGKALMWICEADAPTINGTAYNFPQYGLNPSDKYSHEACMTLNHESLNAEGFVSIDSYVGAMFFGGGHGQTPNQSPNTPGNTGLLNTLNGANAGILSTNQQSFIDSSPWPAYAYMTQVYDLGGANGESLANGVAIMFQGPIEAEIDEKYLLAVENVIDNITDNSQHVPAPKGLSGLKIRLNADLAKDAAEIQQGYIDNRLEQLQIDHMKNPQHYAHG